MVGRASINERKEKEF